MLHALTAIATPMPENRTLLWAAGVGALWTVALIASAAGCATGFTRPDNLVGLAISVACVAVIGAAVRSGDGLRRAAQVGAGVLGGMYFGPSTGALLSVVLVGLGLRDALDAGNRALGIILVVAGFGLGVVMTYGVVLRFLAPTDIRC
jgi:hypothetical protein